MEEEWGWFCFLSKEEEEKSKNRRIPERLVITSEPLFFVVPLPWRPIYLCLTKSWLERAARKEMVGKPD